MAKVYAISSETDEEMARRLQAEEAEAARYATSHTHVFRSLNAAIDFG